MRDLHADLFSFKDWAGSKVKCDTPFQQRHERRRRHGRPPAKLIAGNALFTTVTKLLSERWSPQQIAAHLAKLHPHEAAKRASHEVIYNVIHAQPRGELRKELIA